MFDQFDDRGKIFTQMVSKIGLDVVVQTTTNVIEGRLHIRPDNRLSDEINLVGKFLPLTNATIYSPKNKVIYQTKFLLLNFDQIVWMFPRDELQEVEQP